MVLSGDPTGEAEEAPLTPRGKRSLVRKSTAVFNRDNVKMKNLCKKRNFPVT